MVFSGLKSPQIVFGGFPLWQEIGTQVFPITRKGVNFGFTPLSILQRSFLYDHNPWTKGPLEVFIWGNTHDWRGGNFRLANCVIVFVVIPKDWNGHVEDAPDMKPSIVTSSFIGSDFGPHSCLKSLSNTSCFVDAKYGKLSCSAAHTPSMGNVRSTYPQGA